MLSNDTDIPECIIVEELLNDEDFTYEGVVNTNSNIQSDVSKPIKVSNHFSGCIFNENVIIIFNNYTEFANKRKSRE